MFQNNKVWPEIAAGVLSFGLFASLPAAAVASTVEESTVDTFGTCRLVADASRNSSNVYFYGGRLGCANGAYTHVLAKRDIRFSPDQIFWDQAIPSGNGMRSGSVRATAGHRYYTETYSSTGAKMQSGRV
jgi:hypothetical protein